MPTYEFVCKKCKQTLEVRATVAEKQAGLKLTCSACGGTDMAQVFGGIMLHSSGRAVQVGGCCDPGSGCCGPRK